MAYIRLFVECLLTRASRLCNNVTITSQKTSKLIEQPNSSEAQLEWSNSWLANGQEVSLDIDSSQMGWDKKNGRAMPKWSEATSKFEISTTQICQTGILEWRPFEWFQTELACITTVRSGTPDVGNWSPAASKVSKRAWAGLDLKFQQKNGWAKYFSPKWPGFIQIIIKSSQKM